LATKTKRFQLPGHLGRQLSREPLGGENSVVAHVLESSIRLPLPREEVFPFFADAFNLERITPPHLCFRILSTAPIRMGAGTQIRYRMSLFRVPFSWISVISEWDPPSRFVDQQIRGPYRSWVHTHEFVDELGATLIRDRVEYELPVWPFGELAYPLVRYELDRIFRFRSNSIRDLLLARNAPEAGACRLTSG
jgi:ligand-binding SRPBCC domain-containing protein